MMDLPRCPYVSALDDKKLQPGVHMSHVRMVIALVAHSRISATSPGRGSNIS
jgi:hypothetical protein